MRKQRELVARLHTSLLSGASVVPVAARDIRQRAVPAQVVLTEKRSPRVTELKRWLPDAICRLAAAYQEPYVTISRADLEYPADPVRLRRGGGLDHAGRPIPGWPVA